MIRKLSELRKWDEPRKLMSFSFSRVGILVLRTERVGEVSF